MRGGRPHRDGGGHDTREEPVSTPGNRRDLPRRLRPLVSGVGSGVSGTHETRQGPRGREGFRYRSPKIRV